MIIYGKVPKSHLKAIAYFADNLICRRLSRHLHITIRYKKTENYWGLTSVEGYNKSGKPRHFIIEVNRFLNEREKIMTIAHEMVHVKQYAILDLNEEMTNWRGKIVDAEKIPYIKQPWEKEAYKVGDKLFGEYYGDV